MSSIPGCAFVPKSGGASLPVTTELLKGDNAGGAAAAVKGTDYPGLDTANVFTRGQSIHGSSNEKQLTVKANATQTNNMIEVQSSAGTRQAFVPPSGTSWAAGSADYRVQAGPNGFACYSVLGYYIASGGPYNNDGDLYNVKDCGFIRGRAGFLQPIDSAGNNGGIQFLQRTSGGTPSSNCACIYAKDVSGTAELFVLDEAGNETQISPHRMDGPAWLYDLDDPAPQVAWEAQHFLGIVRYTNRSRLDRLLSSGIKPTSAPGLPTTCVFVESFDAHNERLGFDLDDSGFLLQADWHHEQAAKQHAYDADVLARLHLVKKDLAQAAGQLPDQVTTASAYATGKIPPPKDVRKPVPVWMQARFAAMHDPREPEAPSLVARALAWLGVK